MDSIKLNFTNNNPQITSLKAEADAYQEEIIFAFNDKKTVETDIVTSNNYIENAKTQANAIDSNIDALAKSLAEQEQSVNTCKENLTNMETCLAQAEESGNEELISNYSSKVEIAKQRLEQATLKQEQAQIALEKELESKTVAQNSIQEQQNAVEQSNEKLDKINQNIDELNKGLQAVSEEIKNQEALQAEKETNDFDIPEEKDVQKVLDCTEHTEVDYENSTIYGEYRTINNNKEYLEIYNSSKEYREEQLKNLEEEISQYDENSKEYKKLSKEIEYAKSRIDRCNENIEHSEKIIDDAMASIEIKNWEDIRLYADLVNSPDELKDKVVELLADKKNSPDELQHLVSSMLNGIADHYDHSKSYAGIEGDNAEKLMEHATSSEEISGSICLSEHGLVADMLNEAGIPAVALTGNWDKGDDDSDNNAHATLLYQNSNGQLVFNNYGDSFTLPSDITNIKDAIKYMTKESSNKDSETGSQISFTNRGFIELTNKDGRFSRVIYDEEAAFGDKLDKTSTDTNSMLDKTEIADKNSTEVKPNERFTLTNANSDNKVAQQIKLDVKYQDNGETRGFKDSESVGVDADYALKYKNGKDSITIDGNATISTITEKDNEKSLNPTYLVLDSSATGVKNILDKDNTTIDLFGGIGVHAVASNTSDKCHNIDCADKRIYNEAGLKANQEFGNTEITAQASAGIPLDFVGNKDYNQIGNRVSTGLSIKTSGSLEHEVNPNLTISANGDYNYTQTSYLNHTNFGANLGVKYNNDGTTLSANLGVTHDQEHLSMNLFEEDLKNETEIYSSVEYSPKENVELGGKVSYDVEDKKLKGSAGIKFKLK